MLISNIDVWGFNDVEAAIGGILDWIDNNDWKGPLVDIEKWLISGHSNGGRTNLALGVKSLIACRARDLVCFDP